MKELIKGAELFWRGFVWITRFINSSLAAFFVYLQSRQQLKEFVNYNWNRRRNLILHIIIGHQTVSPLIQQCLSSIRLDGNNIQSIFNEVEEQETKIGSDKNYNRDKLCYHRSDKRLLS